MKHRKTHLTALQKVLLGKGYIASPRPFARRQADAFADALKAGRSHEQALSEARRSA